MNKILHIIIVLCFCLKAYAQDPYITLNFQDISIRSAIQLLADFSKKDIVVNDSVTGNMSVHFDHVHWKEALNVILKTHGLDSREVNGVIFVAPAEEMLNWDKVDETSATLFIKSITMKYARAEEMSKILKDAENDLLSSRGSISVDKRTNTLLIRDSLEKIHVIEEIIDSLDKPVQQVLIEARIVSVNRNVEKDLGIRFGITNEGTGITGTLEGSNALANGATASEVPVTQRLSSYIPKFLGTIVPASE